MSTEIIFGLSVFIALVSFVCGYTLGYRSRKNIVKTS
ncbi:hypothetical protein vecB_106 [Escherichia phage VEcB]|uniref:Uncharacterized protein n=1 Tax=Escherichia phage VEcB TaxID=2776821 RepID=A0A7L8ZH56_9CAUD|nr:hypothetical protein JR328_gp106 [Escherichia phage VEcB]QOI68044.1 hypothetical protein vecB_106 [Escherichia phage VEcB]QXV81597.1 hypothetical protein bas62_0251 [Escherichia phage JohannJBalmer]UIS31477.1 hypothetical protein UAB1_gp106 [Salmonella phage UAB_1]WBF54121.1 hypothetical protein [Escherichia phage EC_OE_11]